MGLVGQKRADILKFAIFVQNRVRNNKMLEVGVFCVKGEQNNNLTKYSHSLTWGLCRKMKHTCKFT